MRKTNKLMLSGTSALVLSLLAVTATTTPNAAIDPVEAIANLGIGTPVPNVEMEADTPAPKAEMVAQLNADAPKPRAAGHPGLKPMSLRMSRRATPQQIAEIERHRQAVVREEDGAMANLNNASNNITRYNRFQVIISDDGHGSLDVYQGHPEPGDKSAKNTGWHERPMSADMQRGLKAIIQRCAAAPSPVYYQSNLEEGDADIGKGNYEIQCIPGPKAIWANANRIDLAKAYMASSDIPLERRQNGIQWRMPFAMFRHYVITTENATIAMDRAECIRIVTFMKQNYAFTDNNLASADLKLKKCLTSDFNWVRRQHKIPEVE